MAGEPELQRGHTGDWVRHLQEKLRAVSNSELVVDGIFGNNTETAVRNFQVTAHLEKVDGIAGPETWAALDNAPLLHSEPSMSQPGVELQHLRVADGRLHYTVRNVSSGEHTHTHDSIDIYDGVGSHVHTGGDWREAMAQQQSVDRTMALPTLADGSYTVRLSVQGSRGGYATLGTTVVVAGGRAYGTDEAPPPQVHGELVELASIDLQQGMVTWGMWNHNDRGSVITRTTVYLMGPDGGGGHSKREFEERIEAGNVAWGQYPLPAGLADGRYTAWVGMAVNDAVRAPSGPYPWELQLEFELRGGVASRA